MQESNMDELNLNGFTVWPQLLNRDELIEVESRLGSSDGAGKRGVLRDPLVADFARERLVRELVSEDFGDGFFPVRAIYFDKRPEANWAVVWHQDLTIAVKEKREVEGFGAWSVKDGAAHVQAPVAILERMVTVRVHLDDADEENGALRVIPGSHRNGKLTSIEIEEIRRQRAEVICAVERGGVMVMRPLLLHASSKSMSARRRRVLHIEYAKEALPGGLEWAETWEGETLNLETKYQSDRRRAIDA
jgi:hypothetical protein